MKTNKYLFLTAVCIIGIIFIKNITSAMIPVEKSPRQQININQEELTQKVIAAIQNPNNLRELFNIYMLNLLGLLYTLIFLTGIANLILFLTRAIRKKSFLTFQEEQKKFPLSKKEVIRLSFGIVFLIFLSYGAETLIYTYKEKLNLLNMAVILNLAVELGVALIILYFLINSFSVSGIKKRHFLGIIQVYTAIIPLIILAVMIVERLGIKLSYNPAAELIFSLKNQLVIAILSLQIVAFAPVAEELLFRAVLYKLIRLKYSFAAASIVTSLIFASIHGIPHAILPLFIVSMGLCYIYEKTQTILAPVIFHSLFNSVNLALLITVKNLAG